MSERWDIGQELITSLPAVTIKVAKDVLQEELGRGFDKNYLTLVDNRVSKSLVEVKFGGKIEFIERGGLQEVAVFIEEMFLMLAPVRTGNYKRSITFFQRGRYIKNANQLSDGFRTFFIDTVKYGLPLERRIKGGIMRRIVTAARRRFPNFAFQYYPFKMAGAIGEKKKDGKASIKFYVKTRR